MGDKLIVGGSLMHADQPTPDFSGYVTRAGVKCSDGRTIAPDAFKHQNGVQVPLVWAHNHTEASNVLGHVKLEHRADGVYGHAFLNDTPQAQNAKELVKHNDINALSIFANNLLEKAQLVMHGVIREVSLVLAGANPGALIDNISIKHGEDVVTIDDEAIIYSGAELEHADTSSSSSSTETDDPTVQEVYDSLTDEQKEVVHYMVGAALENGKPAEHGATTNENKEGTHMSRNAFEANVGTTTTGTQEKKHHLSHDAIRGIVSDAQRCGSLKEAVQDYALKHGIENIDILFPDAKSVDQTPQFDSRRMGWVQGVLDGTKHSPFSRIKSLTADLTFDEARAKGYIKGTLKKEEFFGVSKRTTAPSTVYKKQKLDRDDIIDITDFDVVVWLKQEMRMMLNEEIARAVLVGDGRDVDDDDKIKDPLGDSDGIGIRSIVNDNELYAATAYVNLGDANSSPSEIVDEIVRSMRLYKGSGSPTFYTTLPTLTSLLMVKDTTGRRLYRTPADIAAELGVADVVTVEVMEQEEDLVGIIVNLSDYTLGSDKGGEVNMFDDFDIDYNQYKYLIETRLSGALTKIRSALIIKLTAAGNVLVVPVSPTVADNDVTIVNTTGVVYTVESFTGAPTYNGSAVTEGQTVTASHPIILVADGDSVIVKATPASGYYFENDIDDEFYFEYEG